VSRNPEVLATMGAATVALVFVPLLALTGAVALAGGSLGGVANLGGAVVVAAGALLVVVRVADRGGPAGVARDRSAAVHEGTVRGVDGARVREPVAGEDCAAYLYRVEHDPRGGSGPFGPEHAASGLVAHGPVTVETTARRVALPPSRQVEPSLAAPRSAPLDGLHDRAAGAPAGFLRRHGVDGAAADSFLEADRVRVLVDPLDEGDPLTVVGTVADGRVSGEAVVRRQAADDWARDAARTLRRAERGARLALPAGLALVAAGLALSLV
jgi:hypothetical protein